MPDSNLHADHTAFLYTLSQLEALLQRHGQTFWARNLRAARVSAEAADASAARMVLGLFGGAGSIDDLVLTASPEDNAQMGVLRRTLWTKASALN